VPSVLFPIFLKKALYVPLLSRTIIYNKEDWRQLHCKDGSMFEVRGCRKIVKSNNGYRYERRKACDLLRIRIHDFQFSHVSLFLLCFCTQPLGPFVSSISPPPSIYLYCSPVLTWRGPVLLERGLMTIHCVVRFTISGACPMPHALCPLSQPSALCRHSLYS
jgi:hypothetical protein